MSSLCSSFGVPRFFKKPHPVLGKVVGAGAFAKHRDVTQRRSAVSLLALGDVGDAGHAVALSVLGLAPEVAVAPAGHTLGVVEPQEVLARDPVEPAPDDRKELGVG